MRHSDKYLKKRVSNLVIKTIIENKPMANKYLPNTNSLAENLYNTVAINQAKLMKSQQRKKQLICFAHTAMKEQTIKCC